MLYYLHSTPLWLRRSFAICGLIEDVPDRYIFSGHTQIKQLPGTRPRRGDFTNHIYFVWYTIRYSGAERSGAAETDTKREAEVEKRFISVKCLFCLSIYKKITLYNSVIIKVMRNIYFVPFFTCFLISS